jgi:hypothetical protein
MHRASENFMQKSGSFLPRLSTIDTLQWGEFFRARHPLKTAHHIAARINVPERTVEKWLDGTNTPNLQAFGRLVHAYGPEFLAICLPGCEWLGEASRAARRENLSAELARIERELGQLQDRF